jgi:hypothetical protein
MRRSILLGLAITMAAFCYAQKKWDGGGNNNQWNNDQNWFPDGIPVATDSIILDNAFVFVSYMVELPSGDSLVEIRKLIIDPATDSITLLLPVTNTATSALIVTGSGDAITIGKNGILRNASGAASGTPIQPSGLIKIMNEGRYIHQTPRGNAALIDKLSTADGTEKGAFEFDVPALAGYTVSLTSNTFGTLKFSPHAAGGTKSYSGSGTGNLIIRGDLIIDTGAQVSSTLTADINVYGSLWVDGRFNLIPVTPGSTGRSLKFLGKNAFLGGTGQMTMNANFRVIEITAGSFLSLGRDCLINNPTNAFINYGTLNAGTHIVSGSGKFAQADLATLIIGAGPGIQITGDSGNIQTGIREFSKKSAYIFQGAAAQSTGSAFPDTVSMLGINNPSGIVLTRQVYCADSLLLIRGNIKTDEEHILAFGGRIIRSDSNYYGQVNAGWENSFIDGPLITEISDTGNVLIPIGAGNIFAPLVIRKSEPGKMVFTSMYYPVRHPDSVFNATLEFVSRKEYWSVKTNGTSFSGGWLTFSVRPDSFQPNAGYTPKPAIYQFLDDEYIWTTIPGTAPGYNTYGWISMDTLVTGFNEFTTGFSIPDQPLAFRLLNFSATGSGNLVRLRWQADEDHEKLEYSIEKSFDGMHFTGFHSFISEGRSYAGYEIMDKDPYPGYSYYRLYIASGSRKEYSPVMKVRMEVSRIKLYPNPAKDHIFINFPDLSSRYELVIVNIHGLVVYKTFVNTVTCQIRVNNLRNGNYYVTLRHNQGLITLPFTKY